MRKKVIALLYIYAFEPVLITGSRSGENLRSVFSLVLTLKRVDRFSLRNTI
jgi:hypothetical protein